MNIGYFDSYGYYLPDISPNFAPVLLRDKIMEKKKRKCPNCGKEVTGRSDKKFCSDGCRTMYNNNLYRKRRKVMGKIDHILKKNHNVMDRLYSSGERMVTVYKLSGMGFNFNYMTSLIENPDAGKYRAFSCYDYMYVITDDGKVLIDRNTAILP